MEINPTSLAIIVTLSSLAGVVITSIFNLLNTRITKKSEEISHRRELVIKAAIESWKQEMEIYRANGEPTLLAPLDLYIVHMLKFTDAILNDEITAANIEEKMKEVSDTTEAMTKHINKISGIKK